MQRCGCLLLEIREFPDPVELDEGADRLGVRDAVCLFVCLFVLTTPGMPVVALLPLKRLSQGATQSIPGLQLKKFAVPHCH